VATSEVQVNTLVNHIIANWKTTVQGILSLVVTIGLYFTALPSGAIPQKYAAILTIATGLAKAILGSIQSDAKPAVTSSVTIEATTPIPQAVPVNPTKQ
jgi:hypothetical protein